MLISLVGHRMCSSTKLFVVFLKDLHYFCPQCECNVSILIILIMGLPQKLVLAPGATIGDNTVHELLFLALILVET